MRIKICLTIAFLLFAAFESFAQSITVGVIEFPPHVFAKKDNVHGPAVDYLKALLGKHFDQVRFVYLPTKRGVLELNKGNVDLLFPISQTPDIANYLSGAMFHSVPGLCFNKQDFIPILSSINQLDDKVVGVPAGVDVTPVLKNSNANLTTIEGTDVLQRGVNLLIKGRIDSLYHPTPINIYHYTNPLSKQIACSYFHGYSTGLYIASSPLMSEENERNLDEVYQQFLTRESYEYYFAKQGNRMQSLHQ